MSLQNCKYSCYHEVVTCDLSSINSNVTLKSVLIYSELELKQIIIYLQIDVYPVFEPTAFHVLIFSPVVFLERFT